MTTVLERQEAKRREQSLRDLKKSMKMHACAMAEFDADGDQQIDWEEVRVPCRRAYRVGCACRAVHTCTL